MACTFLNGIRGMGPCLYVVDLELQRTQHNGLYPKTKREWSAVTLEVQVMVLYSTGFTRIRNSRPIVGDQRICFG